MMKKIFSLFLLWALMLSPIYSASKAERFTLSAEIAGLKVGDKLKFYRVTLTPDYGHELFFEVIVTENDRFHHQGTLEHEEMLIMSYQPADGSEVVSDRLGVSFYVRGGDDLRFVSDVDRIYFPTITGGVYADKLLSDILIQENELGYKRISLMRKAEQVRSSPDADDQDKTLASNAFNNYHADNHNALRAVDSLYTIYYATPQGEELRVYNTLVRDCVNKPIDDVINTWEQFSDKAKNSYFAQFLSHRIERLKRFRTGAPAPDFTLTRDDSTHVSLADSQGKYLLIYHFGMCPGSLQVDPLVTELYSSTRDSDSLQIIGISSDKDRLIKIHAETADDEEMFRMNVKERLHSLINHPYEDFDMTKFQNDLSPVFQIDGLPFFIFISPDGRMLKRGFSQVLFDVMEQFKK